VAFILALLAWGVIAGFVTITVLSQQINDETAAAMAAKDTLNLYQVRTQARYLLGQREFTAGTPGHSDRQIYLQARSLNAGPIDQRLCFAVLANELDSPAEALKCLDELDALVAQKKAAMSAKQKTQESILRKLFTDYQRLRYDAPSVTEEERHQLREHMGWFGDLALAPAGQPGARDEIAAVAGWPAAVQLNDRCPDPDAREQVLASARKVCVIIWTMVAGLFGFGLLGFVALVLFFLLLAMRKLRGGLTLGTSPAGVYVETFALWIVLFGGLSIALDRLLHSYPEIARQLDPQGSFRLMAGGGAMLVSLVAIFWPVLRGVPWRKVREDLGLTFGRRPELEPAIGVGCYVMGFPLMIVGILLTLLMTALQQYLRGGPAPDDLTSPPTSAHPIVLALARGDWVLRLLILVLASIIAPLVEETMFRGVLYRHLRELTRWLDPVAGVAFSALISSFIFAVIHPQGVLAVPVLMSLACGFVLAREWRGTLIPSMVAHGLNNGLVLLFSVGMLGD
jgi:membrane protease YdiL (CAAX protease family)